MGGVVLFMNLTADPLWGLLAFVVSLLIVLPVLPVLVMRLQSRQVQRNTNGICPACGYSTIGNVSGVCPECGCSVEPTPALDARAIDKGFAPSLGLMMGLAEGQARGLGHREVGTQHVLLALLQMLRDRGDDPQQMLGVSPDAVRESVQAVEEPPVESGSQERTISPELRRVIRTAINLAARMNSALITPEHVVQAMRTERECGAATLLRGLGVDVDAFLQKVLAASAARADQSVQSG